MFVMHVKYSTGMKVLQHLRKSYVVKQLKGSRFVISNGETVRLSGLTTSTSMPGSEGKKAA